MGFKLMTYVNKANHMTLFSGVTSLQLVVIMLCVPFIRRRFNWYDKSIMTEIGYSRTTFTI